MPGLNLHPDAVAGSPLGPEHGGNTEQPEPPKTDAAPSSGMNSENAGALVGAKGLAAAKKTTRSPK